MKSTLGGIAFVIVALIVLVLVVKIAFKLAALAIVVGIAAIIWLAVKDRLGGGGAR